MESNLLCTAGRTGSLTSHLKILPGSILVPQPKMRQLSSQFLAYIPHMALTQRLCLKQRSSLLPFRGLKSLGLVTNSSRSINRHIKSWIRLQSSLWTSSLYPCIPTRPHRNCISSLLTLHIIVYWKLTTNPTPPTGECYLMIHVKGQGTVFESSYNYTQY